VKHIQFAENGNLSAEIMYTLQDQALRELYFKDKPLKFNRLLKKFRKNKGNS